MQMIISYVYLDQVLDLVQVPGRRFRGSNREAMATGVLQAVYRGHLCRRGFRNAMFRFKSALVFMCICMYSFVLTHTCIYIYIHTYTHIYIGLCVYIYTCMCVRRCVCVCMYVLYIQVIQRYWKTILSCRNTGVLLMCC